MQRETAIVRFLPNVDNISIHMTLLGQQRFLSRLGNPPQSVVREICIWQSMQGAVERTQRSCSQTMKGIIQDVFVAWVIQIVKGPIQ